MKKTYIAILACVLLAASSLLWGQSENIRGSVKAPDMELTGGGNTEISEQAAPGAGSEAGRHTFYVDSTTARLTTHENGGSAKDYIDASLARWAPTLSLMGVLSTGDEQACVAVPVAWATFTGWQLSGTPLARNTSTADATGVTVQIHKLEGVTAADMLSTAITTDATEVSSATAATPPVIDAAEDDVLPGDAVCVDVDAWDDGDGLLVALEFIPI